MERLHAGCLLETIIKPPLFMLLVGLGWDWNNFDLIGGGLKKQHESKGTGIGSYCVLNICLC